MTVLSSAQNSTQRSIQAPNVKTMAGYGAGDFGFNLFWTGLSIYLLIYYTDVLGIRPITASLIFSIAIFWDAITDPIMGAIATRTRSRFGRYRPYLLVGGPLMAISFVFMFAAPVLFPSAVVAASLIAHLLFRTLYTVTNIPYGALSSVITQHSHARSRLSAARMFGAVTGALIATASMPILATELGDGDAVKGWVMVSILFGSVATVFMLIVFASTKEEIEQSKVVIPLRQSLKMITSNNALWIIICAIGVATTASTIGSKSMVYYIKYVALAEAQSGPLLGLQALAVMISIPVWVYFSNRFSKRLAWVCGGSLVAIAQLTAYFLEPTSVASLIPFMALTGFGFGAVAVMFWAMVPDTVEFGEWRSGVRDEGITFGVSAFSMKAATALAVAILGVVLESIGYVQNVAQSTQTIDGLTALCFLIPGIMNIFVVIIILRYPLSPAMHASILSELQQSGQASTSDIK